MRRNRFLRDRLEGLLDKPRSGRPPSLSDQAASRLLQDSIPKASDDGLPTLRSVAKATQFSHQTVRRIFRAFGLQPHLQGYFAQFESLEAAEEVCDIVGLYVSRSDLALALCLDRVSRRKTLSETPPWFPNKLEYATGVAYTHSRLSNVTLLDALRYAAHEEVRSLTRYRRYREFLWFLEKVELNTPEGCAIRLIVPDRATTNYHSVKKWLERQYNHRRFERPTVEDYPSWFSQVEFWFNFVTQQALRRGTFKQVKELRTLIDTYLSHQGNNPRPFAWTATIESVKAKIKRFCRAVDEHEKIRTPVRRPGP
jgi:putative transposase